MQNAIVPEIVRILGHVYPELEKNIENIRETFSYESEHYRSIRTKNRNEFQSLNISPASDLSEDDTIDFAGFAIGFRDVEKLLSSNSTMKSLPVDFAYERLHINHGLTEELIQKIATEKGLAIDMDKFSEYKTAQKLEAKLNRHKVDKSVLNSIIGTDVPMTNYSYMYDYAFQADSKQYIVEPIKAKIEMIKSNGDGLHHIVLNRTNFYHTAGGQDSDIGQIVDSNGTEFIVETVNIHKGRIFHSGRFKDHSTGEFIGNQEVDLRVDSLNRTALSQHHTAMHLLQAALKHVTQQIVFQQSSHVSSTELKCSLGSIGKRIDINRIHEVEDLIRSIIQAKIPIEIDFLMAHDLYALDNVTTIPGELYPDENIRVLKIQSHANHFESIEPCCGTHAHNTGDLEDFCITTFKFNASDRSYDVAAIAGKAVQVARNNGENFLKKFHQFNCKIDQEHSADVWKTIEKEAVELSKELIENQMPYVIKAKAQSQMDDIKKTINLAQRAQLRKTILAEMVDILTKRIANNDSFIIHVLYTSEAVEEAVISDAESVCHDLPVIILNVVNNKIVHGRASIPIKYATNKFNAKHWIQELGQLLNIASQPNKKKKQFASCSFTDIPDKEFSASELKNAIEKTKEVARRAFSKLVSSDESDRNLLDENFTDQISDVRKGLLNETNIPNLVKLEAQSKKIRDNMKKSLLLYTNRLKWMAELKDIDEQIYVARSNAEKYALYLIHVYFIFGITKFIQ